MPPKRKAQDTANANATTTNKKPKAAPEPQAEDEVPPLVAQHAKTRWSKVSGSKNLDTDYIKSMKDPEHAYEFVCCCDPIKSCDDDDCDEDDEEDEEEGDNDSAEKRCDGGDTCPCGKPAASLPDHPFTISRAGIAKHRTASDMLNFRDPDSFGMYTYNDHMAYGAVQVVQNLLLDFDEAYKAERWKEMWALTEGMALFITVGAGDTMATGDDMETADRLGQQIGRMALTALGALDKQGLLKKDSEIENLGWMLALYQEIARDFRDNGLLEESEPPSTKPFKFNPDNLDLYMRAYARTHDIAMHEVTDLDNDEEISMPQKDAKDPWGWTKSFADCKRQDRVPSFSTKGSKGMAFGGDSLDITTWSSAERKRYVFDKKDPLPKDVMDKIKQGYMMTLG